LTSNQAVVPSLSEQPGSVLSNVSSWKYIQLLENSHSAGSSGT
jgi:hypothetical protein